MPRKSVTPRARPAKGARAEAPEPYELNAHNVCAPEALRITPAMRNGPWLTSWWEKAVLYIEAMRDLKRVVMFADDGENGCILASHPEEVAPRPRQRGTK
jgi:hypothetical protein